MIGGHYSALKYDLLSHARTWYPRKVCTLWHIDRIIIQDAIKYIIKINRIYLSITRNILQFWCNARERSWFVQIVSFVLWSVIHQMHYKPQKVKLQNDESSCTTKSLFLQLHTKFSKHKEILTEDTFQTKTFLFILSYIFSSCNTKCFWLKVGVGDGPPAWSLGLVLVSFSNVLSFALSPSLYVSLSLFLSSINFLRESLFSLIIENEVMSTMKE